jgi:hypothetical protein
VDGAPRFGCSSLWTHADCTIGPSKSQFVWHGNPRRHELHPASPSLRDPSPQEGLRKERVRLPRPIAHCCRRGPVMKRPRMRWTRESFFGGDTPASTPMPGQFVKVVSMRRYVSRLPLDMATMGVGMHEATRGDVVRRAMDGSSIAMCRIPCPRFSGRPAQHRETARRGARQEGILPLFRAR